MRLNVFLTTLLLAAALLTSGQAYADDKPVKVFILTGQSNMVGHGKSEDGRNPEFDESQKPSKTNPTEIPGGIGCLRWAVNTMPETYGHGGTDALVDANGDWLVRDDVYTYSLIEVFKDKKNPGQLTKGQTIKGPHTIGFGKGKWIGPEYGFGMVVGNALDDEILIIKVATGGTSLYGEWRSPTAVKKRGGEVGYMWPHLLKTVKHVLDNLDTEFPNYAGRKTEIVGFGWHQGYNDTVHKTEKDNFGPGLVDFIADVRATYGEDLPFVIATTSMFPADKPRTPVELAQMSVAEADPLTVAFDARPCWRDKSQSPGGFGFHWNHNGVTHYLIGKGMGEAYLGLVVEQAAVGPRSN
jgi:alpha-galactosidase